MQDGAEDAGLRFAFEAFPAGEHFVHRRAETEDVAAAVDVVDAPLDLLRRHVLYRAHDRALQRGTSCRWRWRVGGELDGSGRLLLQLRQTEVEELAALFRQHNVSGLDVAMRGAFAMRLVERVSYLDGVAQHLLKRQRPFEQSRGQRLTLQILHDEILGARLLADVIEHADVRVLEVGDGFSFALESLAQLGVEREMLRENFDSHVAIQTGVEALIHFTHAPRADLREDLVRPQHRAWYQSHVGGKNSRKS